MLDELGDVLFQVYFLSLLLEERGKGDLATVADHCRLKLIRRHPHVFGEREAETAGDVVRNWNQIKRDEEQGGDPFGHLPETLPGHHLREEGPEAREERGARWAMPGDDPGDRLLAAVQEAVDAGADPELSLRAAADRYKATISAEEEG